MLSLQRRQKIIEQQIGLVRDYAGTWRAYCAWDCGAERNIQHMRSSAARAKQWTVWALEFHEGPSGSDITCIAKYELHRLAYGCDGRIDRLRYDGCIIVCIDGN